MIVVSDTSPLNYLTVIGQVNVLRELFGQVIIPSAVARELTHERAPAATLHFFENPPDWVVVRKPLPEAVEALRESASQLGQEEIEAICLARELHAELLLIDERRATKEARGRYQ